LINSLSRGLQILHLLAAENRPLGVTEIAERLAVDPSTSYRLLATLEKHKFIRQESSKKYALGFGVVTIASALLRQIDVAAIATPYLRELMISTGESAHIAVADGNRAAFVAQASAPGMLRVDTPLGSHEPLYCTAVGKALLAEAEPISVRTLVGNAPLTRYSPNTITNLEMLIAELQRTRERGYAFDDEELHAGVRCIAAAVRDHSGTIVAAVGISAPASRLTRERIAAPIAAVRQTAVDLSAELGYTESNAAETAASS
jgi:IclR family negative regulator of allantoin and glyoxylate utilization operon